MIAFHIFGRPVYRYGIMYLISFLVGYRFLWYVVKQGYIKKVSPTLHTILDGNVDLLLTYIIIGGILGGRLGEVFIYERSYYSQHPGQILATRNGGMSFIGGIIGALIAVTIFLYFQKAKKRDFLTLTDLMAAIAPFGIMLGRIGNWLNRELYGPVILSTDTITGRAHDGTLLLQQKLYSILEQLHLLYDYGTAQFFENELRLNTNFLASFGEGLLILVILQTLFRTRRTRGKLKSGLLSGLFLVLYALVRFALEYVRMDSLDDYLWGLTSTQWLSILMAGVGALLLLQYKKKSHTYN